MNNPFKRFAVLCDYGCEGWQFLGENTGYDSLFKAVEAREAHMSGSPTIIVEIIPVLEAYRRAEAFPVLTPEDYAEGK